MGSNTRINKLDKNCLFVVYMFTLSWLWNTVNKMSLFPKVLHVQLPKNSFTTQQRVRQCSSLRPAYGGVEPSSGAGLYGSSLCDFFSTQSHMHL